MECLNCEKEFTQKRDTAKYCSDNCRVKAYNKRSGKTAKPTIQMQSVLARFESALQKMEAMGITTTIHNVLPVVEKSTEQVISEQNKTPEEWVLEKREIPEWDIESYNKWFAALEASGLTKQQKSLIKIS